LLLMIVLAAILLSQVASIRTTTFWPTGSPVVVDPEAHATQSVLLTINFGDGRPLQNEVANWHEQMTVADLLQQEPRVSLRTQGSGELLFLTDLNGVSNEGAGGRNWTYSVNGQPADRSLAVYELRPNDHVLWTFGGQE
jgi:hypothetical protein